MLTFTGGRFGPLLFWAALAVLMAAPLLIAATSPLLAGRDVIYIVGGFAGILALILLLIQPLLAAGLLPGISLVQARRWHRWTGSALAIALALHIIGLYLTSPPDMIDALLLVAPTLYSIFGVIGMWALILIVMLVLARARMGWRITRWRIVHNTLAVVVVVASVTHALMIEGAMGALSKLILCLGVVVAMTVVTVQLRWHRKRG